MMISMDKQYRARCGYEVRIYAICDCGPYPVHGAILIDGCWRSESWSLSGKMFQSCIDCYDLIEVKPRIQRERWVNIYEHTEGALHEARHSADFEGASGAGRRIACIKVIIDCEEGEGL